MPFKELHPFLLFFNALIVEEADVGLLCPIVSNIVLLYYYIAFHFAGIISKGDMFMQSINKLSQDERSQAESIILQG